jgi:hypothetical protein
MRSSALENQELRLWRETSWVCCDRCGRPVDTDLIDRAGSVSTAYGSV